MARKQAPDGTFVNTNGGKSGSYSYPAATPSNEEEQFDWGNVSGDVLARAIDTVTARGHAISFAINRAHTTGCITILAGDERPKYYCETVGSAERTLTAIANS